MVIKEDIEKAYLLQKQVIRNNHTIIFRDKFKYLEKKSDFVQIVSGIRRCGKSTLLQIIMSEYKNIAYINFEDPRLFNFEVTDFPKLEAIFPEDTEAYFFDEIQNVENWEIYIRQLHDLGKKIYITGSNASLLSKDLGTKLTGRYLNTELFPFSYVEYLRFLKSETSDQAISVYLKQGGFPEFLKSENEEVLQNLFKDILLRDIAVRYGIRNSKVLFDLALFLISNVGKEVSYTKLKNTFQIGSTNSIIDYLNWMEDAYLLFFLQRFSWSAKSMAINPKKVYAIDNGLINANTISFNDDAGRKLENAVFIYFRNKGKKLYYFREKGECDFLVFEKQKCIKAVQVCYEITSDNLNRECNGLLEALLFFGLEEGFIITFNQKDTFIKEGKTIYLLPIQELFLE
ncbi:ATP-binding protein [Pedobacter puniceum]|jgi:predicted AAA+ superfamily ATPase|uniref:AAA family ATPase n=1 Tax=Pedobacter puniceum TaxID=2666136 RepID=A0A7K0FLX2_9SPHI|nr:ATP-binding protein [Pedobacter puniceum]MRX46087.1 AAA family ATPase [Pedobacter puniceum]